MIIFKWENTCSIVYNPEFFYTVTITLNVDLKFLTFIYVKHVWGILYKSLIQVNMCKFIVNIMSIHVEEGYFTREVEYFSRRLFL